MAGVNEARHGRLLSVVLGLLLVALTFTVYAPSLNDDFVSYDDPHYVTENAVVQQGLTADGLRWAFLRSHYSNWHPLTWLSHMLDVELFGDDARGHHATSLVLHTATTVLLFVFLLRATGARWSAALVAALFAVHPLRVESVAWVAERKDVLAGFFGVLVLIAWGHHVRTGRVAGYVAALVLFAAGLMAKSMLVTWPALLFLLDRWPFARELPLRRRIVEKLPFLALALVSIGVTYATQRAWGSISSNDLLPVEARLAHAPRAWVTYLAKSVWPTQLAVFHPHPALVQDDWRPWSVATAGALALLAFLTAGALALRRSRPWLLVGWLWFLGTLVPVIGLVQVGAQGWANRYYYLPGIGLGIVFAFLLRDLQRRRAGLRLPLVTLSLAALLALSLQARTQAATWKDGVTLYEHALRVTEHNAVAHTNLGEELRRVGRTVDAQRHFESALEIDPFHFVAWTSLGLVHVGRRRWTEAEESFRRALRIQPDWPDAHAGLGFVYGATGRDKLAEGHLRRAVELAPEDARFQNELGLLYARLGRVDEAGQAFVRAVTLAPDFAHAHANLGDFLVQQGDGTRAKLAFEQALGVDAELLPALNGLAWVLATAERAQLRDGERAVALATRCVTATLRSNPDYLATLAAAQAESGRFEAAVRTQAEALAIAPPARRVDWEAQLGAYEAGRPRRSGLR